MNFRTIVNIPSSNFKISHADSIIMLGSCFIENIGSKLVGSKFDTSVNPFGVLYNPYSIWRALKLLLYKQMFAASDLFQYNGLWHSFSHHGIFSDEDKEQCLANINGCLVQSAEKLRKASVMFITFGTAYIYTLKQNGEIVGNCHKLPANFFERRRLDIDEIVDTWLSLIEELRMINPQLKIIFTVSPIRHLKDGAHQNQLSKASLLLAIEKIRNEAKGIEYFPAYEIVMDELRDYRFYADDMTHPSEVTVKYVWERFCDTYFTEQTKMFMKEWAKLASAVGHRPLRGKSIEYKCFLEQTLLKINLFQEKYPYICCRKEIDSIEESLSAFG